VWDEHEPDAIDLRTDAPVTHRLAPFVLTSLAVLALAGPAHAKPADSDDGAVEATATAALSADAFVSSMGVNTHGYYLTHTFQDGSTMADKVADLGIRNIRDGIDPSFFQDAERRAVVDTMAESGVRYSLITDYAKHDAAQVRDWIKDLGPEHVASVENRNEPDLFDRKPDGSWPIEEVRAYQKKLWTTLKGDPATQGIEVIGPPVTSLEAAEQFGSSVADVMDRANIHNYLSTREPETAGWGEDGYGSLDFAVRRVADPMKPGDKAPLSTETCYQNSSDGAGLPEEVSGRYIPRQYLFSFARGIPRTYCYELWDEGTDRAAGEQNYGFLRNDGSAKPVYTAVKGMTSLLADPGGGFTPGELAYTVNGAGEDVEQVLLQKRDGTFYLALWLGTPSFDPLTNTPRDVPDRSVTLTVPTSIAKATAHAIDDSGAMGTAPLTVNGGSVPVTVTDQLTFVELSS
jgi:hypothetical protein